MMMRRCTIDLLLLLLSLSRRNIFMGGSRRRNSLAACRGDGRVLRLARGRTARGRAARGVLRLGAATAAGDQVAGAIARFSRRSSSSNFETIVVPMMIHGGALAERWMISSNWSGNGRKACSGARGHRRARLRGLFT